MRRGSASFVRPSPQPSRPARARQECSGLLATVYLTLAGIGSPLALIVLQNDSLLLLIGMLAGMLIVLTLFEWRRVGHPLTPAGIMAVSGLLLFTLRPMTIVSSGSTSPGAVADSRRFVGTNVEAAVVAQSQVIIFFAAFGAVYFYFRFRSEPAGDNAPDTTTTDAMVHRAGLILLLSAILALACVGVLIQSSGGLGNHFSGLSHRTSFLAGRFYLTLGYIPLAVALCLYVLVRRKHPLLSDWGAWGAACAVVLILVTAATGARGPLLLGAVLPLLLLRQSGSKPLSSASLVCLGVSLITSAMVLSLTLRENVYDRGASFASLGADPVGTLLTRITSGAETRPFDSLVLLNKVQSEGDMSFLLGKTYISVLTWFIPGELLPSKSGGANTWFTVAYVPRFYYPDRIETSISAIGEGFANFGYFGIILAASAVGFAAAKIGLSRRGQPITSALAAVLLTPLFFSLLRGDSYQNLPLVILIFIIGRSMLLIVGVERRRCPDRRKDRGSQRPHLEAGSLGAPPAEPSSVRLCQASVRLP